MDHGALPAVICLSQLSPPLPLTGVAASAAAPADCFFSYPPLSSPIPARARGGACIVIARIEHLRCCRH